jgi:hypothetical protein
MSLHIVKMMLWKLFQESGEGMIKVSGGGDKFKYVIFDTLYELL